MGKRLATAGAADPSGPFGHGRLLSGDRVTWFYCHMNAARHSCQRTLGLTVVPGQDETIHAHVTSYDDGGHGKPSSGAIVHAGGRTAKTDDHGDAVLIVPPGRYRVYATKKGSIRSFGEEVDAG